jgi:hypothetical protein
LRDLDGDRLAHLIEHDGAAVKAYRRTGARFWVREHTQSASTRLADGEGGVGAGGTDQAWLDVHA